MTGALAIIAVLSLTVAYSVGIAYRRWWYEMGYRERMKEEGDID